MFGYDSLCEHGYDFSHANPGGLYCEGPETSEDMSQEEAIRYLREKLTGEPDPHDIWGTSTLVVTFTDGEVIRYPNVRFLIARGYTDPIVQLPNGWLEFENDETPIVVAGVRSYTMDHTE